MFSLPDDERPEAKLACTIETVTERGPVIAKGFVRISDKHISFSDLKPARTIFKIKLAEATQIEKDDSILPDCVKVATADTTYDLRFKVRERDATYTLLQGLWDACQEEETTEADSEGRATTAYMLAVECGQPNVRKQGKRAGTPRTPKKQRVKRCRIGATPPASYLHYAESLVLSCF